MGQVEVGGWVRWKEARAGGVVLVVMNDNGGGGGGGVSCSLLSLSITTYQQ